jgi:hypothetical protein
VADFPLLKTGAVAQYPAGRRLRQRAAVLRFVDGSEQSFRREGAGLKSWSIELSLLDDGEVARIEQFFATQGGRMGSFSFTDPWDSTTYEDCRLDSDEIRTEFTGEGRAATRLAIRQNRV